MEIIKRGKLEHVAQCNKCHTEMRYDKYDLRWTHTEQDDYYIICPVCKNVIWITGDKEHAQMYREAYEERKQQGE